MRRTIAIMLSLLALIFLCGCSGTESVNHYELTAVHPVCNTGHFALLRGDDANGCNTGCF